MVSDVFYVVQTAFYLFSFYCVACFFSYTVMAVCKKVEPMGDKCIIEFLTAPLEGFWCLSSGAMDFIEKIP